MPPGAVPGLLGHEGQSGWQLAQRVWQDSGVSWEDAPAVDQPAATERSTADPYTANPYTPARYAPALHEPAAPQAAAPYAPDRYGADAYAPDPQAPDPNLADQYEADRYLTDPHPTRTDLAAAPTMADSYAADSYAANSYAADSRLGMGPWPVQQPSLIAQERELYGAEQEPEESEERDPDERDPDKQEEREPRQRGTVGQEPAGSGAPDFADGESAQAPPLPRRVRRFGAVPNEYQPGGFPGQSRPHDRSGPHDRSSLYDRSGQVPLPPPAFAAPRAFGPPPLSAPVPVLAGPSLSEPDELFRAWQGSVRDAAAPRTPWSTRRPASSVPRGGRGRQVAKFGVPAVVIVAVGAGALLMLTGRANEMLAERSSTGALSSGASGAPGVATAPQGQGESQGAGTGVTMPGYPGEHGTVGVTSVWSTAGTTIAVGTADGHLAVWRRGIDGGWALESASPFGAVSGTLTAVTDCKLGWLAVGSVVTGGATKPAVFTSADGVTWEPLSSVSTFAGSGSRFLGVTSTVRLGYVIVGSETRGGRTYAALWSSPDLRTWTAGGNGGLDGRLAASTAKAAAATADGFVAVGSHGGSAAIWTSADGRNWNLRDVPPPAGARSATLSVVAASGDRVVAAGYALTGKGDIPVVVASADGGASWQQIVLPAPDGPGTVTALTATSTGFVAVGLAGPAKAQRTVEWTSADGLTWSAPSPVTAAAGSPVTALADKGTTVTGIVERGATSAALTVPTP